LFLRFAKSFSVTGLLVGTLFFCASLTPSLLPRVPQVQGALAGVSFALGYGVGVMIYGLWTFLELRVLAGAGKRYAVIATLAISAAAGALTLNRMFVWQNSIRDLMQMPQVDSGYPFTVLGLAVVTALLLLVLVRGLIWLARRASAGINRVMPRRISIGLGTVLVALAVGASVDGLVVRKTLVALDETFALIDLVTEEGMTAPAGLAAPAALIRWQDIGRNGKRFLTDGPDRDEIAAFTGRDAQQPVRVYAGFNTGETLQERAAIAVAELKRSGGFERSVLVVATATGTGWLDPGAVQPLAFLHGGDLAIVSLQYSYLPSWLTLMVDPDRSRRAARALFAAVFAEWTAMPKQTRPRLYLFGLSLGALGSEAATDLMELLADPIDGALWAGPPFAARKWAALTAGRDEGSPQWRPRFRDGLLIRFMTQSGFDPAGFVDWGRLRIVYLQHASDPMSFFSPDLAFSGPDWLTGARGPDISPYFRWFPIVTFLQVGFDVPMATTVPPGYGHNFVPAEYIDAWIAVSAPSGWSRADTVRLKQRFADFSASPL
jgi:uncharacterized membrane protein